MSKHYCTCECDDESLNELSGDGQRALLRALENVEQLRHAVPAWAVADANAVIDNLELVVKELGLESLGVRSAKARMKAREELKREQERAAKRIARDRGRLPSASG